MRAVHPHPQLKQPRKSVLLSATGARRGRSANGATGQRDDLRAEKRCRSMP
jgi:hypothetical protein